MQEDERISERVTRLLFGTRRELGVLQHEIAELTRTVERQGALIAQLKKESARHDRNDSLLCAYILGRLCAVRAERRQAVRGILRAALGSGIAAKP